MNLHEVNVLAAMIEYGQQYQFAGADARFRKGGGGGGRGGGSVVSVCVGRGGGVWTNVNY